MTNQKPIEPLPSRELVTSWHKEAAGWSDPGPVHLHIASRAAQWGYAQRGAINEVELQKARDEQLDACCDWLDGYKPEGWAAEQMRNACRLKPKSLAEQKQAIHDEIHQLLAQISASNAGALAVAEPIRAALERLRELEGNQ